MSHVAPPALPIVARHVALQFSRRKNLDGARFLYGEVAERMMSRLRYIRLQPERLLDAGCGTGDNRAMLHERFPQALYLGLDHSAALLEVARARHVPAVARWWQRRSAAPATVQFIQADLADSGLPPESLDLVWSNMALHWHPRPHDVLAEWRRVLKIGAPAMFSCLGPGSLRELRQALVVAGLRTATPEFVDMHDFGDLLVENGFTDPVMDQEVLTLTYQDPRRLLADLRMLGGNPARDRRPGLTGRAWIERLCTALATQRRADGSIPLTIEVAYGHAWRASSRNAIAGEAYVPVSAITRSR